MDRRMVYTGALPQDLDINQNMQFAMVSDGFLAEAVLGTATWSYGLGLRASSPASMTVFVGRGAMGLFSTIDATNPGSSAILDSGDPLVKIGINRQAVAVAFTAPASAGQSQIFLIEGQVQEIDNGPLVQQYYNPTPPNTPFAGPGNTGVSSNTIRQQFVAFQSVAGAPATTGSQIAPGVTAGWVPLWLVTISNGQTTLTSANFASHPAAPVLPWALPQLAPGFSRPLTILASTTWVCPAGVKLLKIRIIAGGGGGSGSPSSGAAWSGSGGGAGAYGEGIYAVVPGTSYAVTIGAAGLGGATDSNGSNGGTSSFGTFITCTGGAGGVANGGGGFGGSATGGNIINHPGAIGGDGVTFSPDSGALYIGTGCGGNGAFGGAGQAGTAATGGSLATCFGSGGGGAYKYNGLTGGNGSQGICLLEF